MKYPYMTLPDETEITHSDIHTVNGKECVTVYIERPVYGGFSSAFCELPDYVWTEVTGFTEDDLDFFSDIIHKGAHLIYRFAKQGGFGNASSF